MPPSERQLEQRDGRAGAWRLPRPVDLGQQAEPVEGQRQRDLPPPAIIMGSMLRTAPVMPLVVALESSPAG
jgi:hypothetical protein